MPPHKLLHKEKSVLRNVNFLRLLSVLSLFRRYNHLIMDAYPLYVVVITCYQDWEHKALCFLDVSYFFLWFEFSSWVLYFTRIITFRFFRIAKNQVVGKNMKYIWKYFSLISESLIAGLPRARSARGTEPHTHRLWSTSFPLVVTWLTERTYVRTIMVYHRPTYDTVNSCLTVIFEI